VQSSAVTVIPLTRIIATTQTLYLRDCSHLVVPGTELHIASPKEIFSFEFLERDK
jgi:hypothetical protein